MPITAYRIQLNDKVLSTLIDLNDNRPHKVKELIERVTESIKLYTKKFDESLEISDFKIVCTGDITDTAREFVRQWPGNAEISPLGKSIDTPKPPRPLPMDSTDGFKLEVYVDFGGVLNMCIDVIEYTSNGVLTGQDFMNAAHNSLAKYNKAKGVKYSKKDLRCFFKPK